MKPAGVLLNWHWLIKHPVEFSKNNRYPANRSGALQLLYPALSVPPNPGRGPEFRRNRKVQAPQIQQKESRAANGAAGHPAETSRVPPGRPRRASEESRSLARLPGGSEN